MCNLNRKLGNFMLKKIILASCMVKNKPLYIKKICLTVLVFVMKLTFLDQ